MSNHTPVHANIRQKTLDNSGNKLLQYSTDAHTDIKMLSVYRDATRRFEWNRVMSL